MNHYTYPEAPKLDTSELLKLSPTYKKQVTKTLLSMLLFIVGYILVLALALVLVYFGVMLCGVLLLAHINFITIVASGGILLMVIMFFVFIVKFMFNVKKDESDDRVELSETEQPELFKFVRKVCEETKAPFPKKIFLSNQVNASVFYNSSFLSMFFPVRKNLEIGLGLVNCVNISEFKAIVAHEFGHFSQSSTRLGSYMYRFNKMIHDLLYENTGWNDTMQSISSVHAVISLFGAVTVFMANTVIKFFMFLYKLINKSYLSLSREMEFNADNVAVSVSGSAHIINALRRIEFGQFVFDYTVQGLFLYETDKVARPKNFFTIMSRNAFVQAKKNHLQSDLVFPVIDSHFVQHVQLADRLQFKDEWSTHPPIKEREENANKTPIPAIEVKESAWLLFKNVEKLQEKMSSKLVSKVEKKKVDVDTNALIELFEKKEAENDVNEIYKDYYAYAGETFTMPSADADVAYLKLDELFTTEQTNFVRRHRKNEQEAEVLKSISDGHSSIKKFEFDGKKYSHSNAIKLYNDLKKEIEENSLVVKAHNKKIADWFYYQACKADAVLAQHYFNAMKFRCDIHEHRKQLVSIIDGLVKIYQLATSKNLNEAEVKQIREDLFQYYLNYNHLKNSVNDSFIPAELLAKAVVDVYKEKVFNDKLSDPNLFKGLDGFEYLYKWTNEVLLNMAEFDTKVFVYTVRLQDEVLKKMALL